ncbi:MAG: type I-B CRISPR-associated protein Cas8b1/Cst1 [Bacteroidota bacterium]
MDTSIKEIDKDLLIRPTGDPFADIGGFVIEQLWGIPPHRNKSILELIEYVTKIYVRYWNAKLHAFFLNSKITQAAFKGERKIEETLNYYQRLLEATEPHEMGFCRIIGHKTELFSSGRDNHMLAGSGTFINFHHSFQSGLMLSKEVLIRILFVPFGALQLSDKIAVLTSNVDQVTKRFVRKNVLDNLSKIGAKSAEGVLRSEFNNPASALFDFVHSCISDRFEELVEEENVEINLYHFTNFGASPEVVLYNFSSPLFSFYRKVLHRDLVSGWKKFVGKHFYHSKHKNTVYDPQTELFQSTKQKSPVPYEEYKTWINWIYQNLLNGKSILPAILNWNRQHSFHFNIVILYQNHLKHMDNKTLDKIEALAEFIIRDEGRLKSRIGRLNRADKVVEVRRFILSLIKMNHSEKNEKALLTLEDFVNYLFPDGTSAKEIRDLLLIALYQKMHENEIFFEEIDITNDSEDEEKLKNS